MILVLLILTACCSLATADTHLVADVGKGGSDLAIIQQAIDGAEPDDLVVLPAGILLIDGSIRARRDVHLRGAGIDKTIILRMKSGKSGPMIQIGTGERDNGVNRVEISHLTLDGGSLPLVTQGIRARHNLGHRLHHLSIRNLVSNVDFGSHGIHFREDVDNSIIERCVFENIGVDDKFGCAIRLSRGSTGNRVIDNTIRRTGRGGVFAEKGSTHTIIRRNMISDSGLFDQGRHDGLSIELWDNCGQSLIEDNTMDHWLSLDRTSQTAVRRNRIVAPDLKDYKFAGLELADGTDVVMTDNTVGQGAVIGLSISAHENDGVCRAFFGRNQVLSARDVALQVHDGKGRIGQVYFYKNLLSGVTNADNFSQAAGIRLLANPEGKGITGVTLEGNRVVDNNSPAILVNAGSDERGMSNLSAWENLLADNSGVPVRWSGKCRRVAWTHNEVRGNHRGENSPPHTIPPSGLPRIKLLPSTLRAESGQEVSYSFEYADNQGDLPAAILWDLGVGVPQVESEEIVTSYQTEGAYPVSVIAWDDSGLAARDTVVMTVYRGR